MFDPQRRLHRPLAVSVLFNEPKLLKCDISNLLHRRRAHGFSALQRAEIAEIFRNPHRVGVQFRFSALQRAEIAEIDQPARRPAHAEGVSVLFNEPKLLK